jgi:hypothetical protein
LFSYHFKNGQANCHTTGSEPLRSWRKWATLLRRVLESIERTRKSRTDADNTAWDVSRLALAFGHLRPVLVRSHAGELVLRLAGSRLGAGLPAALSYQLLVLMSGGNGLLVCAECGKWFESPNRRDPSRNAYCDQCGRPAAMRAASRRYYENHKQRKEQVHGSKTRSK